MIVDSIKEEVKLEKQQKAKEVIKKLIIYKENAEYAIKNVKKEIRCINTLIDTSNALFDCEMFDEIMEMPKDFPSATKFTIDYSYDIEK